MNFSSMQEILYREENKCSSKKNYTKENIIKLEKNISLKEEIKEILLQVLYLKNQEIKILEQVVNTGLAYTYPEKHLNFKLEFAEKNNRVVPEFFLNELLLKPPFIGDGGGIISVISLLLYVTFVKLQNSKIVLLDEVDAMVDIEASIKLFDFLHEFSAKNSIAILCITHKNLPYSYIELTEKLKLLKVGE